MSNQRFKKLNEITQNKWIVGCPVEIEKGAILLDTETQNIILQLRIRNVSENALKFVGIKIYRYDMADDAVAEKDDSVMFAYPDTSIAIGSCIGEKIPINLGVNSTRKVKIIFDKIVYANDEVWRNPNEDEGIEINPKLVSDTLELKLAEQYNKEYGLIENSSGVKSHDYIPTEMKDYWICTCGFANFKTNKQCGRCKSDKESIFKVSNKDYLHKKLEQAEIDKKEKIYTQANKMKNEISDEKGYSDARSLFLSISGYKDADGLAFECKKLAHEARVAKEKADEEMLRISNEKKAEEKKIEEKKKRFIKKISIFSLLIIILSAILILSIKIVIIPAIKYNSAKELLNNKQYNEAITGFTELGNYKDCIEQIKASKYNIAIELSGNEQYEQAVYIFNELGDYKDCKEQILICEYNWAIELASNKQYEEAINLFTESGDYKDGKEQILICKYTWAIELSSNKQYEEAINLLRELGDYKDSGEQIKILKKTYIEIGDSYQGGIVAYILQPEDPGYIAGEQHGLIAATADQCMGIDWCCENNCWELAGTGTIIGTGLTNTYNIITQNGPGTSYAAGLAHAYSGGGYSDWYLPSKDELEKLYINKEAIGGFDYIYWSSSEYSDNSVYVKRFGNGYQPLNEYKHVSYRYRVRAVRAF